MSADLDRRQSVRPWFAPRMWGLHALAVVALAVTIVMGLWQLGVYDTRQAGEQADRQHVPTVPLRKVLGPDEPFTAAANHRPVAVAGTYAPAGKQFWVSGRTHDGHDGYWLVAPFLVAGTAPDADGRARALLVVRGWAPDNQDLPATPAGRVDLRAALEPGEQGTPGPGGLGEARTTGSIRIPLLVGELPYDLYSAYGIVTDPAPPPGLNPVAPPAPETSWTVGWRNLIYAIQWWVFGAFAVFMWWRMASEMVTNARKRAVPDGPGEADHRPVS